MPIFVDTDNSDPKNKLYNGSKAGRSAAKVEARCSLSGSIVRYPKGVTMKGAKGDEMLSLGWSGSAEATGTSEGSLMDCVEAIIESMMKKGIPIMTADFPKR